MGKAYDDAEHHKVSEPGTGFAINLFCCVVEQQDFNEKDQREQNRVAQCKEGTFFRKDRNTLYREHQIKFSSREETLKNWRVREMSGLTDLVVDTLQYTYCDVQSDDPLWGTIQNGLEPIVFHEIPPFFYQIYQQCEGGQYVPNFFWQLCNISLFANVKESWYNELHPFALQCLVLCKVTDMALYFFGRTYRALSCAAWETTSFLNKCAFSFLPIDIRIPPSWSEKPTRRGDRLIPWGCRPQVRLWHPWPTLYGRRLNGGHVFLEILLDIVCPPVKYSSFKRSLYHL